MIHGEINRTSSICCNIITQSFIINIKIKYFKFSSCIIHRVLCRNIGSAIVESSKKTNFEKNSTFAGSEFGNFKTTKDQTFSSDACSTLMDIDLNPSSLSDSTLIIHKDQDKSHDEEQKVQYY